MARQHGPGVEHAVFDELLLRNNGQPEDRGRMMTPSIWTSYGRKVELQRSK